MPTLARKLYLLSLLSVFPLSLTAQTGPISVTSPDGKLEIRFATVGSGRQPAAAGQLVYQVSRDSKPVIARSNLGLRIDRVNVIGNNVRITSSSRDSKDETYEVVHGKSNPVRNHYNSARVEVAGEGDNAPHFAMEARAYDDGVAFRYSVPEQPQIPDPVAFRLQEELTEFRIAKDSIAYPLYLNGYQTSYEDEYNREALSGIVADRLIALPLLIDVSGAGWVAITEAHLDDYAGAYLRRDVPGANTGLRVDLASVGGPKVEAGLPHQSPWRVVMVAPDVGKLIESNIVINLNPPSEIADTSWIKPGKSAWDWWFGRVKTPEGWETGMDTRTFRYLVDFAAESGFDYVLIDDGWSERQNILQPNPGIDVPEIIRYAKSKGVGIWLWLHWTGVERHMDEAFPIYAKWGAVGMKIDFMDRDDQWMVNWYRKVVKKAAEHRLMVDFHGAYKPDGLRRTYPNLMTREGVMGLEYTKWSRRVDPAHNVMLPFTRMLAGPMDYTPGAFRNVTPEEFQPRFNNPIALGTRAHQLAMFVVYESPFVCAVDHPSAYRGEPAFQFIKDVPPTWDETRVINAAVGNYITIARRRGREWYVGSMTDWTPRDLKIPLSFLGEGSYTAEIYADAPDADRRPANVNVSKLKVKSSTVLEVKLAPGGGHAIRIVPD